MTDPKPENSPKKKWGRAARLREWSGQGEALDDLETTAGPPQRTWPPIVLGCSLVFGFLLVLLGGPVAKVLGGLLAFLGALIGGLATFIDRKLPVRGQGAGPEEIAKGYVSALLANRVHYAYGLLAPSARGDWGKKGPPKNLEMAAADVAMLKAHRSELIGMAGGVQKTMSLKSAEVLNEDKNRARVAVHFATEQVSLAARMFGILGYLLFRKTSTYSVKLALGRGRNDEWYLYDWRLDERDTLEDEF